MKLNATEEGENLGPTQYNVILFVSRQSDRSLLAGLHFGQDEGKEAEVGEFRRELEE